MFHGLNAPLCIAKTRSPSEVAEHQTRASFFDPFSTIFEHDTTKYLFPSRRNGSSTFPDARCHSPNFSPFSLSLTHSPQLLLPPLFSPPSRLHPPFPSATLFLFPPIHEETVCPLTSFVTRWKRVVTPHRRTKGALSKTYAFALRLRGSTWSRFKWLSANFPLPLFATTLANALILNRILLLQNAASLIWRILILTPFT